MDIDLIRTTLRSPVVGCRLVLHEEVDSTMEEARREARKDAPEGTVILAETQRNGRGRFRRTWHSPRGNIHCSIIFRPTPQILPQLAMVGSLAVLRAVRFPVSGRVVIKWPNDILVNGRKIAGVLVEASWNGQLLDHAVLGIGVNVTLDPSLYPDIASVATNLSQETREIVSREEFLVRLLGETDALYAQLQQGLSLRQEWMAELDAIGKWVTIQWHGQEISGYAEMVDEEGRLILRLSSGGREAIEGGDVITRLE